MIMCLSSLSFSNFHPKTSCVAALSSFSWSSHIPARSLSRLSFHTFHPQRSVPREFSGFIFPSITKLALSPIQRKNIGGDFTFGSYSSLKLSSTSIEYAIDPNSQEAEEITSSMGISSSKHAQLVDLAALVNEWNDRINLISRIDCTESVVFGRHILPSIALYSVIRDELKLEQEEMNDTTITKKYKIVDVGTGGGFPGLPLAVLFPMIDFVLLDSVGKKLKAVQNMADELGLENVKTHHGRAEELQLAPSEKFDIALGRSVAALPKFCFWIQNLIKNSGDDNTNGRLVYIIGGELERNIINKCRMDVPLEELIQAGGSSDKRVLVFDCKEVKQLAKLSGEKLQKPQGRSNDKKKGNKQKKNRTAKGDWKKKENSVKKDRGYDGFQRWESS